MKKTLLIISIVVSFFTYQLVFANVDQYDNEYYDYDQCVQQVLFDLESDCKKRGKTNCISEEEKQSNITVYCGNNTMISRKQVKK